MSQIVDDLRQVAIEIKTETQVGGNTAARVGGAFERVADALEGTQQIEDMDAAVAAVQQAARENEQTIQDIVNSLAVVQTTGQSTSAVMSQKAVTDSIMAIITDRVLYMLEYILRQAIYISDQNYNIGYLFSTFRDGGDVVSVPDIAQDANTLTITISADTGATIYYTIDGSVPTSQNGILYSEPFVPVEDCVVKAIAYGSNNSMSLMASLNVIGSGIIVFKDANLEAVAKAATTADVVVTLPDSTTTTVKGLGWDKDHDGVITLDDMRQVTSLRSFNSQKWVQYLDVLKYTRFTSMDNYQFFGCSNLKELNIPGTCRTTKGITQCTSLQKLIFEEGVTNVGEMTGCAIVSMKLPGSLTTFGGMSNCGTSLRSTGGLVIPKNVTAFPKVYNTKVGRIKHLGNITTIPMGNISYAGNIEVYLASNVVPTKTGSASQGAITKLYVPDEMIPLYAESADWASLYNSGKIVSINNWVD